MTATQLTELHSPKQVAIALGVSESSLKRWCDRGLIPTVRTAGGHRKLATADVLQFVRQRDLQPAVPGILGLPSASPSTQKGVELKAHHLANALLAGDESLSRQIVFNLIMSGQALPRIFDDVVARAFHEIGDRWACQDADIYQERRGCEIMMRTLVDVRRHQRSPESPLSACGGTVSGDNYTLPTLMVEIALRECGIRATSLGTSIPVFSLVRSIQDTRPSLFWLCVSHISDQATFHGDFAQITQACTSTGTALVVGGRALTQPIRERMVYSAFCDTMQQLTAFAGSILTAHGDAQSQPSHELAAP